MRRLAGMLSAVVLLAAARPHPARAQDDDQEEEESGEEEGGDEGEAQTPPDGEQIDADAELDAILRDQGGGGDDEEGDEEEGDSAAIDLDGGKVRVPLPSFAQVWAAIHAATTAAPPRRRAPAVVLGESHYDGRALHDGPGAPLSLTLHLGVTLGGGEGTWKTVPLVGDDVVLARASVDGKPIGVTTAHGYQVWVTRRTGELVIDLDLLVPARGPRGSTEYDFRVVRTPVTSFSCRFPRAGLEPRLDDAVQSAIETTGGETVLAADLRPTTRVHVVGFHDLGDPDDARAKAYAETLSLLSVDETSVDVFTVIRYTILYAGAREFTVEIPKGVKVVSADGRGAFRYEVEESDQGTLLRGETAFPIRDSYEISLRLERDLGAGAEESFAVPLPRARGVEREIGWLAVEVPGKTKLEEVSHAGASAIDTRQLPPELLRSAVSPILRAYRYSDAAARDLVLRATRLPEQETASESIDRVRAFTVVSSEGAVLTEMRLTLRNRLRHSLSLALPADAAVRSALLDGRPVKPSRNAAGELVVPLDRSRQVGARLEPVTLHLVFEDHVPPLRALGRPQLGLPSVDLPVSSLAWSVFLPTGNLYTTLAGDIHEQAYVGQGFWSEPLGDEESGGASSPSDGDDEDGDGDAAAAGERDSSAYTGAMPVRIELPKTGVRLEYERYWLPAGQPAVVQFRYLRRWLAHPLILIVGLVVVAGAWAAAHRRNRALRIAALAAAALACWLLARAAGGRVALLFGILGLLAALPHRRLRAALASVGRWARTFVERYRADREQSLAEAQALHDLDNPPPVDPAAPVDPAVAAAAWAQVRRRQAHLVGRFAWRTSVALLLVVVALALVDKGIELALQLAHPLGG